VTRSSRSRSRSKATSCGSSAPSATSCRRSSSSSRSRTTASRSSTRTTGDAWPDAPAIAFLTLGCPKNEVDSDRMRASVLGRNTGSPTISMRPTSSSSIRAVSSPMPSRSLSGPHSIWPNGATSVPAGRSSWRAAWSPGTVTHSPTRCRRPTLSSPSPMSPHFSLSSSASPERQPGRAARPKRAPAGRSSSICRSRTAAFAPARTAPFPRSVGRIAAAPSRSSSPRLRCSSPGERSELVLIGQDTSSWGRDFEGPEDITDVVRSVSSTSRAWHG
jgi:hypothetical protein